MNEEVTGRKIRTLIVDDDKITADILKDFLSDKGRSVDVCHDGLEAIESLEKKVYDLIIVDLVMPKAGGLEVLKHAKRVNPDVIVIIITGYASVETAIRAIKEGAYDYIRKPFKLEEIKIAVENATDRIKLNEENRELLRKLQDAYNELMVLKKGKDPEGKKANINFFSSNLPNLHYLYNKNSPPNNNIDKLQALSSLKEDGLLTADEFDSFKRYLLKVINAKG